MRERYQREIEEILTHMEKQRPSAPWPTRLERWFARWRRQMTLPRVDVTPAMLMIAGFGFFILSFPFRFFAPQLYGVLTLVSLVLFLVALVLAISNRSAPGGQKMWRGRQVDYTARPDPSGRPLAVELLWRSVRRWWKTRNWGDNRRR